MHIDAVIPCVGYDDYLALTLPGNLKLLDSITVLTEPEDSATVALVAELGVDVFATRAWRRDGPLSKASAINEWVSRATTYDSEQWLMVLDADMLLFAPLDADIRHVDPRGLYSLRRRICETPEAFQSFLEAGTALGEFPLDIAPAIDGKLWNMVPTSNPASLAGYLHLWCPMRAAGRLRYPVARTAEAYDLDFALSFPEELRNYLRGESLHLGPTQVNWAGRRSPRWTLGSPIREQRLGTSTTGEHLTE